jgi:hypothetical protein
MGPIKPNMDEDEIDKISEDEGSNELPEGDEIEDETKKKDLASKKDPLNWVKAYDTTVTRAIIKYWILRARFR